MNAPIIVASLHRKFRGHKTYLPSGRSDLADATSGRSNLICDFPKPESVAARYSRFPTRAWAAVEGIACQKICGPAPSGVICGAPPRTLRRQTLPCFSRADHTCSPSTMGPRRVARRVCAPTPPPRRALRYRRGSAATFPLSMPRRRSTLPLD